MGKEWYNFRTIPFLPKERKIQMKFNIRLTALLLTLIMVIGLFASCETGSTEETTVAPETTVTPETTAEDTTPAQASTFDLIVNGEAQVKIIRPKDLASTDASVVAAVKIRNEIEDATGVKFSMADDFKKATEEYDDSTVEILVGNTAHAQVGEAISGLSYGDYTIKAVGNKIVVFGFTYDAISYAAKQFAKLVKEYAVETDGKYNVSIPVEALNIVEAHSGSKHLSVLPTFDGATFSGTYETNLDCDEIILEDVTLEGYNAYITKLEGAGFTKYTGSDFSGNLFTTLYNKELTLNVGYYKPYDECRIIMEPFSEETLIGLAADNNRPTVTTSQITMLGCEYQKGDGSFVGNGLSLLFRLSDGSFVIVDGGHSGSADIWANNLVKAIEEQAKDYATGKDIRIAAWFVSHSHGDHNGMLNSKSSAFKKFTVERVIANFMTDSERTKSINAYSNNWSSTEGSGDDATRTAAANMGADFIVCHVGQRFFFGDTVFEILYTVESYGPQLVNALNTSTIPAPPW